MIKLYAILINKGVRSLDDVPENIRKQVEAAL
jgi:hypothetical protein